MTYAHLILPYPPSVNGLYAGKARRYLSPRYKAWIAEAEYAWWRQSPSLSLPTKFTGPVKLTIAAARPDKRKRDISNIIKAPEDFLVRCGVLLDDSQVEDVRAYWSTDVECGIRVEIESMKED